MGRPWPWKLDQIWSLERDARGRLWAGTIPGGLFRSDDRGATWTVRHAGPGTPAPGQHVIVGVQGNHLRVAPAAPH